MEQDIKYIFETERINSAHLKLVVLDKCPKWMTEACEEFKKDAYCHYNTMHLQRMIVSLLPDEQSKQVKYVIGYILRGVPVEHAFLKIGDKYFDPTIDYEETKNDEVYELLSLDCDEVKAVTGKHGTEDHGVLMLNLRKNEDYKYLFNFDNEEIMIDAIKQMIESEHDFEHENSLTKMKF
ncbi:hypothetical protein GCM10011607_11500 [Shewanella inventionis]|uniref:Uncharacterized protein n=1 Tax=Shewanella inventionis TaxID=1738770 RepID=A0ABQ1IUB3_9GAMM|nr:hypothetical protein [Shewanella inventionis]GGB52693.1 hypothetical protein GCM10011607_11500 [Shewanella inventionis]